MSCRLCGANRISRGLNLRNSPPLVYRLLNKTELANDSGVDVQVYTCQKCGFVQLIDSLDAIDFSDYLMLASHSQKMNELQENQAQEMIERFDLKGKKIVDVGCGDGNFMSYLMKHGAEVAGIEPADKTRAMAQEKGYKAFEGYVHEDMTIPESPYDAFTTRQVIEHVPYPHSFLKGINASLKEGAVGMLEIQCLEQAMEHCRFYDFFVDRLNYFSKSSFSLILEMNGFKVLEVKRVMDGEYLQVYVEKDSKVQVRSLEDCDIPSLVPLQDAVTNLTEDLLQLIEVAKTGQKKLAIWGAGAKGVTTLAVAKIGADDIEYLVDSDPLKRGLYTPVSHLEIVDLEHFQSNMVDIVIITALAYKDEIANDLRNKFNFTGLIYALGPRLEQVV